MANDIPVSNRRRLNAIARKAKVRASWNCCSDSATCALAFQKATCSATVGAASPAARMWLCAFSRSPEDAVMQAASYRKIFQELFAIGYSSSQVKICMAFVLSPKPRRQLNSTIVAVTSRREPGADEMARATNSGFHSPGRVLFMELPATRCRAINCSRSGLFRRSIRTLAPKLRCAPRATGTRDAMPMSERKAVAVSSAPMPGRASRESRRIADANSKIEATGPAI